MPSPLPEPPAGSRSETLFGQAREAMPSGSTRHTVVTTPYPLDADSGVGCRIRVEGRTSMSSLMMTDQPVTNYRQLSAVMPTLRGGFVGSTPMTNDDIDFTIEAARRALTKLIAA